MSTKSDKTKEKLLSSMRRTKAGASESPASPATTVSNTSAEKTPAKATPAAKTKAPAKAKAPTKAPSTDSFQSGRRIWPD